MKNLNIINKVWFCFLFVCTGRRSRRNSLSEDSQLTIENFGGSQDQLNMIGRSVERERKFSNSTVNNVIGKYYPTNGLFI